MVRTIGGVIWVLSGVFLQWMDTISVYIWGRFRCLVNVIGMDPRDIRKTLRHHEELVVGNMHIISSSTFHVSVLE